MPEPTTPTQPDLASLAADYRATTLRFAALVGIAEEQDNPAILVETARAALAAGRPAAALRFARRGLQRATPESDPDGAYSTALGALQREAEAARRAVANPVTRGAEALATALLQLLRDSARLAQATPTDAPTSALAEAYRQGLVPLDVVNDALARCGAGGLRVAGETFARQPTRPDRGAIEAFLSGHDSSPPCEVCGAPRWSWLTEPGVGEYCTICGHGAPEETAQHRRMLSHAQLRERLQAANRETEAAKADAARARAETAAAKQGLERLKRLRKRLLGTGAEGKADLANMSLEDLEAHARDQAAKATAASENATAASVEARRRAAAQGGE
jgi:hypothetical protein